MPKAKKRLDHILLERKLVEDLNEAKQICMEGFVIVDGQKSVSPAQMFPPGVGIRLRKRKQYVGRGALKLEAAFEKFDLDVESKVGIDLGAATGGFTQVLLNHGAAKVYAIDTAYGKLDDKLRDDPRVVVMEQTDARTAQLDEKADIVVMDISLIPLKEILPSAKRLLKAGGDIVCLLKPQYETRDPKVLHHGVVRKREDQDHIRDDFIAWAQDNDYQVINTTISPVKGRSGGNIEFLLHLRI